MTLKRVQEARNMRARLIRHGIRQNELADRLGLYPSRLNQYLNGWVKMPVDVKDSIKAEIQKVQTNG